MLDGIPSRGLEVPLEASLSTETCDTDASLVSAALDGDREAFGRIVARHQASISAIAYGGTGDRDRAEDLAQETFLEAWRSLARLREPAKLRPWLCGIARNLVRAAARRAPRDPAWRSSPFDPAMDDLASPQPSPAEQAAQHEEQAVVRRALAEIPAPYREALVLFYWEDQSVERVAEELDLTEDAVRQRLSRGRRMLDQEIAAVVEQGLVRARPGKAFTVAVIAALPAGTPGTAAAASGLGGLAASAAAGAGMAGALAGSAVGLLGGAVGAMASILNTSSPRERRFMTRMTLILTAVALGVALVDAAVLFAVIELSWSPGWLLPLAAVESALGLWAVLWVNRRQREIQIAEGTLVPTVARSPRERRFLVFAGCVSLAYTLAFLLAQALFEHHFPETAASAYGQITLWSLYLVGLMQGISWINRRQQAIRAAEGQAPVSPASLAPSPDDAARAVHPMVDATPRVIYGSLAGGVVGGVLWMFPMCAIAGDWLTALAVFAVSAINLNAGARAAIRHPERYFQVAFWQSLVTCILTLVVLNLRYEDWMVFYRRSRWYQPAADWPLWAVDLAIVGLFVWLQVGFLRRNRNLHRRG